MATDGTWFAFGAVGVLVAAGAAVSRGGSRASSRRRTGETQETHHQRCATHLDHALRCTCERERAWDQRGAGRIDTETATNLSGVGSRGLTADEFQGGREAEVWVKQQARKLRNSGLAEHQILPHLEAMIEDGHTEFIEVVGLRMDKPSPWNARYHAAYQAFAQASGW